MGMDRRLRLGSQPFRNQCRGTGEPPQVYAREKTFGKYRERERGAWGTNYDHSFPLSQLKITTQVAFCLICNRKQERGRLMLQTPPRRAALPSRLPLTGTPDLPGFSPTHGISRIHKLTCALFMFTCIKSKIKELKCKFSN